jgi:hypothetical protein
LTLLDNTRIPLFHTLITTEQKFERKLVYVLRKIPYLTVKPV